MRNGKDPRRDILCKIENHESLAFADLRNVYLSCMDFSNLDLRGANFEGCKLAQAIMDGADLSAANFSSADLTNTSLKNTNLSGALFKDAIVGGADFSVAEGLSSDVKKYLKSKGATGF
jgi:uncharacterized protein YjbI with pentapeptide repeats